MATRQQKPVARQTRQSRVEAKPTRSAKAERPQARTGKGTPVVTWGTRQARAEKPTRQARAEKPTRQARAERPVAKAARNVKPERQVRVPKQVRAHKASAKAVAAELSMGMAVTLSQTGEIESNGTHYTVNGLMIPRTLVVAIVGSTLYYRGTVNLGTLAKVVDVKGQVCYVNTDGDKIVVFDTAALTMVSAVVERVTDESPDEEEAPAKRGRRAAKVVEEDLDEEDFDLDADANSDEEEVDEEDEFADDSDEEEVDEEDEFADDSDEEEEVDEEDDGEEGDDEFDFED